MRRRATSSSARLSPSSASKLEKCTDGMNSREKNARIVCRMKSVEVTRVMPSR